MTVRIELTPEVAANLAAQAEAQGLPLEAYVQRLIEDRVALREARKVSLEEMETALDELAEMGRGLPHLSDYALTRESMYEGHD